MAARHPPQGVGPALVEGGISFRLMLDRPDKMKPEEMLEVLNGFDGIYLLEDL